MKVNIDQTLEVSDEQRKQIAAYIDDAGAKKRDATRDEMKQFIWSHGERWEDVLSGNSESEEDAEGDVEADGMDLI